MNARLSTAAVSETLARYWPKATYTPAQIATIAEEFRGLDIEQADAVAASVYRAQKSGRREPNVRMIADQAAVARREATAERGGSAAASEPGGATDFQSETWALMRRVGVPPSNNFREFYVCLFRDRLERAWATYCAPRWGYTEATHGLWWWRVHGSEVRHAIGKSLGDDAAPEEFDRALAEIFGDVYPTIAEWEEGRPARLKAQDRAVKEQTKARRIEAEERGLNRRQPAGGAA